MTAKEKALELVEKFEPFADYNECDAFTQLENMRKNAKHCAVIAIDEIINNIKGIHKLEYASIYTQGQYLDGYEAIEFYEEVKQEIEKL